MAKKSKKYRDRARALQQQNGNKKIKKEKNKGRKAESINATVPDPDGSLVPAIIGEAVSRDEENGKNNSNRLPGFIFMCNAQTKPECYRNRVFGLPAGNKDVVEKIKPGTKLFLFDFDVKLLYGIYEASSTGKLDLEPAAFGGRFRAQVRFRIYKDCIPLPESHLRTAIKDNYKGSKFTQELNAQQVKNLISSFPPIVASSSAPLYPPPNAVPQRHMPPPATAGQLHRSLASPFVDPYLTGMIHGRPPPVNGPLHVHQRVLYSQHGQYGTTTTADRVHPSTGHQGPPASSGLYHYYMETRPLFLPTNPAQTGQPNGPYDYMETRQPILPSDPAQTAHESYLRSRNMSDMYPQERPVGLESGYHELALQREGDIAAERDNAMGFISSYPVQPDPYAPQQHAQSYAPQQQQHAQSYALQQQHAQSYALQQQHAQSYALQQQHHHHAQSYAPQHVQAAVQAIGRPGLAEGSVPVPAAETRRPGGTEGSLPISSYYSFAGASQLMH